MRDRCNSGLDGIRLLLFFLKLILIATGGAFCVIFCCATVKKPVRPGCFGCIYALEQVAGQQKSQLQELAFLKWPRQESNLDLELRKLLYYPLYYKASVYFGAANVRQK